MAAVPSTMTREQVRLLQRALKEKTGIKLVLDGDFGPASIEALKVYQKDNYIPVTGVYDSATQLKLAAFINEKYMKEDDYLRAAKKLGVRLAAVKAAAYVEGGADQDGFLDNGECDILFERHQFYAELLKRLPRIQVEHIAAQHPHICNPVRGGYKGGLAEWGRLKEAMAISKDCAYLSTSWGMFQVMGYNHLTCGYASVEAYVADMEASEGKQLDAWVAFLSHNHMALEGLRTLNWRVYARAYNGPDYEANDYNTKLAQAYARFEHIG